MAENQQIQDPSLQGTSGLRGLDGLNRLKEKGVNIDTSILNLAKDYRGTMQAINQTSTPTQDVGFVGVNDSMFDEGISSVSQLDNLANTRGELQPWYSQVGAGLSKGALLAGTTFLDGTLGLLVGAGTAIGEGRVSGLWDNDFSKAMQSVNEWSEEAMPNYYTDAEREGPWYENVFTANFIGDKFIKNLGFTVGAFYSGNVAAGAMKALKLPQIIGYVTKSSKAPAIVTSGVGATISAVNEGRVQALNNSKDWFELQKLQLDDQHKARLHAIESNYAGTEMYPQLMAQENANYEATLGRITKDRLKMGNMDMLTNLPILTASNVIQFGKMYANGFKTARKSTNIVGKAGEYATSRTTAKGVTRALLNPLSEGTEELLQSASGRIAGNYYADDVNNFYKAKIDPTAEQETVSYIKSFAEGINETVNDASSWEEFFIGSLTGAMGMPRFRGIRNEQGGIQSPVTLEGGTLGEFREYREAQQREETIANYMNKRVQSPEFINYYQGLIRHNKYQNDMNQAVEDNNEFEFKNAEHGQLISDITMFDNAGRLEDLTTLINSSYDTSDANLQSIVDNTTSTTTNASGKESKVGPFIDKNGNPMFSTPDGKQEMIDKLTQTKDEMLSTITEYTKIKDDIDVRTEQRLNDTQLEELTWLKSQIGNWKKRGDSVINEIRPILQKTIRQEKEKLEWTSKYREIARKKPRRAKNGILDASIDPGYILDYSITPEYTSLLEEEQSYLNSINKIEELLSKDSEFIAKELANDKESYKFVLDKLLSGMEVGMDTIEDANSITTKLGDAVKMYNARGLYNTKLKEYLENPSTLNTDIKKSTEKVEINLVKEKILNNSKKTVSEIVSDDSINPKEEVFKIKSNAVGDFEDATLAAIAKYEEAGRIIDTYDNLTSELESLDVEDFVKDKAKRLIDAAKSSAESTNELLDIASEIYSDPSLLMSQDELQGLIAEGMSAEEIEAIHQSEYNRVIPYLNDVITKVLEDNKVADSVPEFDSNATEEVETVGYDQVSAIEEINKEDPEDLPTKEESVEEPTPDLTQQDFDSSNATSIDTESSENPYKYLRSGISQYPIYGREKGDFTEYADTLTANSPQNIRIKAIHSYLSNTGAYNRVNTGKVPVGTKIYFSIDSQLNESAGSTVILLVNEAQEVVGVLPDKSETNASKYVGLIELINRIETSYNSLTSKTEISDTEKLNTLKEVKKIWDQQGTSIYKKVKENEDNFKNLLYFLTNPPTTKYYSSIEQELKKASITNPVFMEMYSKFSKNPSTEGTSFIYTNKGNKVYTTVAKNMIGRPLYTTYNNSSTLNAIHTVQDSNGNSVITPFTLSIAIKDGKNATLLMEPGTRSSQRLSDREMSAQKPLDATKGMPYLAFPTSRKSKKGSVVTTQIPFSMPSFNDVTKESRLGKEIMSVLEAISKLKNDPNTIGKYVSKVKTFLSLPTLNINFLDNGDLSIRTTEGTAIIPVDNINGESFYNILKGSGFQVSRKYINSTLNGQSYNELIGELATANMLPGLTHTVNDWIAINPLDSNNKEIKATPPKTLGYNPNVEEAPVESTTSKKDKEEPTVTKYSFGSELLSNDRIDSKDVRVKKVLNNKNKKLMWDNLSGTQQAIIANRKGPIKTQIIEDLFRAYNVSNNSFDEVLLRGDVDTYLGIKGLNMEVPDSINEELSIKTNAISQGNFMKAPNGNPTNLTEKQWLQVRTKDFKNWFGDWETDPKNASKVIDENGEPLVTYHGSDNVFDSFNIKYFGQTDIGDSGKGFYFTPKKENTYMYGDIVYPVFLNIRKLLKKSESSQKLKMFNREYRDKQSKRDSLKLKIISIQNKINISEEQLLEYAKEGQTLEDIPYRVVYNRIVKNKEAIKVIEEELKEDGLDEDINKEWNDTIRYFEDYDGVVNNTLDKGDTIDIYTLPNSYEIIVKKPTQIKSAIDNIGSFDSNNEKIRYRRQSNSDNNIKANTQKEVIRIKKILPNIQFADKLVDGLISINKDSYAYGQFKEGIITLSNQAIRGTAYHEAFHGVTQTLLSDSEYKTLFEAAKDRYGNKSVLELEELLAEDFREYMQYEESSWVGDVLKFFRRIKHLISNILGKDLYIDNLFYRISQGEFANRISNKSYNTSSIIQYHSNKLNFNNLNSTQLKYLKDKNITESEYSKFNDLQKEVLFKCIGI